MNARELALCTGARIDRAAEWLPSIVDAMAEFQISTPARQAAFLAQIGHESGGLQMMSPQALREMDASAPGELNLLVPIPAYFPPGQARLSTILEYRCNALQDVLRPINVEMNMWFEVRS